ncbi:PhzF family phenazine biosynthesis protein [Fulvivirga sedimenti]|uniref:PhzF family phenazine biosynthesis protein n=1 Tax=Fulvivirga sedimenti TaxID=2879465 RepID=A0A9X1HT04_9BACT|nr:PhzF family phenazine biosynthesis protein [Fulvivirga sedimenti]MCA6074692.1 PhzF family phenazine biosynthesis protein [Fulvivirga sedimenti]MCA6075869.1 PhzF family phenazine biosynthesis protein [Fulvivirga sedimenti]MCA6076997.1 PhzF family phenazine biosynthesis protein [Fulvivirga sedimenti]
MEEFSIYTVFNQPKAGLLGNTAAVVYQEIMPSGDYMQRLAADLNQPATTFIAPAGDDVHYLVRWFAPDAEIGLCGHGTLAAIAHLANDTSTTVRLIAGEQKLYGQITAESQAVMELDSILVSGQTDAPDGLQEALGKQIVGYFPTPNKDIVLLETEEDVFNMEPDFAALRQIKVFGYAVTAPGNVADFVSRTLVPHVQQLEDHATGSSHAALAPFWAERLGKTELKAVQLSPRGGYFKCQVQSNTTRLQGYFQKIATGKLTVSEVANVG